MKLEGFRLRPTALWLIFGPVVGCMWLAAVNYSNNLVYAILYLIASLTIVSVFHTWRNLKALHIEHTRIHPAFAGEDVRMEIYLANPSKLNIYGFHFARLGDDLAPARWKWGQPLGDLFFSRRIAPLRTSTGSSVRILAGDTFCAEVFFPGPRRGVYRFETLQIRTSYPFGLVWAKVSIPVNSEFYVYPQAKGRDEWPVMHLGGESNSPTASRSGDDFAGVRAYMPGESLRHVDWKAFARGRPLSIKQFSGGAGQEMWLDASEMARMPLEARLSQLALWIVNAEKEGIPYALKLGRTTLPLGQGPAQERRALETLAVAGLGST